MNINNIVSNIKYSGITKILKNNLLQNTQALDEFYSATKNKGKVIGNLPRDIIQFLFGRGKNKKESINKFKDAIALIGESLQSFEAKKLETADKINLKNFIGTYIAKLAKINIQPERIPRIVAEMRKKLTPDKSAIKEYNEILSEQFTKILKDQNILKSGENVRLTYLSQGVFKNAFKLEFLDKEGKNLIHPKVLLSFKKEEVITSENQKILSMINNYMLGMKRGEYITKISKIVDSTPTKVIPPEQRGMYKETLIKMYDDVHAGKSLDKLSELIKTDKEYQAKYNGILPESNIIMFLKNAAGKSLERTNFINIPYIDPEHNIAIAEYSDELLPMITKKVNLNKLGIGHFDLENNKNNMVGDRIIDYGNIKKLNKETAQILSKNRIARRYYNKIEQIKYKNNEKTQKLRIRYWNDLYDKAINHKIPNHNDVLKGLEVSKIHISEENLKYLHDATIIS